MSGAIFLQLCEQPLCNFYGAALVIAYVVGATAAILAVMAYVRKKRSDRALR